MIPVQKPWKIENPDNVDMASPVFFTPLWCFIVATHLFCTCFLGTSPLRWIEKARTLSEDWPHCKWCFFTVPKWLSCSALCSGILKGNYEKMMKIYQKRTCNVIQFNQVVEDVKINHLQKMTSRFFSIYFQGCWNVSNPDLLWFFISALLVVFPAKRQWVGEAPEASAVDEAPWPWFLKETDRNWGTSHLVLR